MGVAAVPMPTFCFLLLAGCATTGASLPAEEGSGHFIMAWNDTAVTHHNLECDRQAAVTGIPMEHHEGGHANYQLTLFGLSILFLTGAMIEHFVEVLKIPLPYTMLLLVSGAVRCGHTCRNFTVLREISWIGRWIRPLSPHV